MKNDIPAPAVPEEGKKKGKKLFWIIPLCLLLLLLLIGGGVLGVLYSFTEKRAPFPRVAPAAAMEQFNLMMKIIRQLQNAAAKGKPYPKNISITFSPKEIQTVTKFISSAGYVKKEWGKLFFQIEYHPEKRVFHTKGILHIDRIFLKGRQVIADMDFQLQLKDGEPTVRVTAFSLGGRKFSGPFPKLESQLSDGVKKALDKKRVRGLITGFHIGEKGEGELLISVEKFLSGPGKMLLYRY